MTYKLQELKRLVRVGYESLPDVSDLTPGYLWLYVEPAGYTRLLFVTEQGYVTALTKDPEAQVSYNGNSNRNEEKHEQCREEETRADAKMEFERQENVKV